MRIIESVEVTEPTKDITLLDWLSTDGDFGRITIVYNGEGGYNIDTEYLGMDSLVSILSKWKETKSVTQ